MDPHEHLLWLVALYDAGRIDTDTFRAEFRRLWLEEIDPAAFSAWVWTELSGVAEVVNTVQEGDSALRELVHEVQERLPIGMPMVRADSGEVPKVRLTDLSGY